MRIRLQNKYLICPNSVAKREKGLAFPLFTNTEFSVQNVDIVSENSKSLFTEMWTNCGSKFGDKPVSITYWVGSLGCDKLNGLRCCRRPNDWQYLPLKHGLFAYVMVYFLIRRHRTFDGFQYQTLLATVETAYDIDMKK